MANRHEEDIELEMGDCRRSKDTHTHTSHKDKQGQTEVTYANFPFAYRVHDTKLLLHQSP